MRRLVAFHGSRLVVLVVLLAAALPGQTLSSRRLIRQAVDEAQLQTLPGNVHALARSSFDQGVAPANLPLENMLLVLNRSSDQDAALKILLENQQNPASAQFHHWLTPQEFGRQFGAAGQDIQTVTAWLQSHGFQVTNVANGKNVVQFSGTAAQVQEAFHTEIHKYVVNGQAHWANASNPQIPAALGPAVAGIATLHNFTKKAQIVPTGRQFEAGGQNNSRPQFTSSSGSNFLTPADYATIYNINPLYNAGITGAGVNIAIVARTNIEISDVASFRSTFGLSVNPPTVIVNGTDPGDVGGDEEAEAVLDTSWAGAVAPGATVKLVVSKTTNASDGVDLSEEDIIDNNLGDVMSESFGDCEAEFTRGEANFYLSLAQQAAAQGITYAVAAGDSGSAGCDDPTETSATGGVSVNLLASTPYTVAVGGTEFNENGNAAAYWSAGNASGTKESALSYIPEDVWNESCTVAQCGRSNAGLWSGGGGVSTLFTKPSWQTGVPGIPNDGFRDVPDISLTAAAHDAYLLCIDDSCTANGRGRISFQGYSGTSAATPSFAGIMALVVQQAAQSTASGRQGQADNVLYALAAKQSFAACNGSSAANPPSSNCIFNDVTVGANAVPGEAGYGAGSATYLAEVGYDLATGLGSMNVTNLVNGWTNSSIGGGGGTPISTLSTTSIDFGTTDIGVPVTKLITISNTGTARLVISSIGFLAGPNDFTYSNTCGTVIIAGGSCTISVTFSPTASGTRTQTLVLSSTANLGQPVALTGVGVATATEMLSTTGLDFGSQKVVTRSGVQTIFLTNSTVAAIGLGSLAVTGANPGDFAFVSACPVSLSPGANCTLSVLFTPLLVGPRTAAITVPISSQGAQQTIVLNGIGTVNGLFEIVNARTGKVLDLTGGSDVDGTLIQQYALNGSEQQQWHFTPIAGGAYAITNAKTGKALDVTGLSTSDGALIQEYTYLGGSNQQWQLVPYDDVHYEIVNVNSGKVLDVVQGSFANGAQIQQYSPANTLQQLWVLVPVGAYNITNNLSGDVLDVVGASTSDNADIQQSTASGARQQQWQPVPVGGGYYAIVNRLSGGYLDLTGSSSVDGTIANQFQFTGGIDQYWRFAPVSTSGSTINYAIINAYTGKALDDTADSTLSGTLIQEYQYFGTSNQQWQLSPVTYYSIVNVLSGAALDVPAGSTASGTVIQQYASDGLQQQQWQLIPVAGGAFSIVNNLTGKVLAVSNDSTSLGALIEQSTYSAGQSQQWELNSLPGGSYEISNVLSGYSLDVLAMSTANGALIQQYQYFGTPNQQWYLQPAEF